MDDLLSFDSITLVFKHTRAILTGGDSPSLRLGTRVLPLGTAGGVSHVKSLRHLNAPLCAASGAAYQFVLDTATGDVIVGMASADISRPSGCTSARPQLKPGSTPRIRVVMRRPFPPASGHRRG